MRPTLIAAALAALAGPALAQSPTPAFPALEPIQAAANAKPGPRTLPAHVIPPPQADLSPAAQALVAAPYRAPAWNANPPDAAGWRAHRRQARRRRRPPCLAKARETLGVTMEADRDRRHREGLHFQRGERSSRKPTATSSSSNVHGGGYVYGPGEAGTAEAMLMAAYGGYKVIEFDYRMPPDAPYPAAMDGAMAVWKAALAMQDTDPGRVGRRRNLDGRRHDAGVDPAPQAGRRGVPGAIAPGTPWSDLTETGDSYRTNEWVDNVLVSYTGYLSHAERLYADGHDIRTHSSRRSRGLPGPPARDPDSGTRDLFLSNTVRTHRNCGRAGVDPSCRCSRAFPTRNICSTPPPPKPGRPSERSPLPRPGTSPNSRLAQ